MPWFVLTAVLLGMQFTGGHAQMSAYLLIAFLAYLLVAPAQQPGAGASRPLLTPNTQHLTPAILVLAAGVALAAGHLLPAWEYVPQTDRGARVPWERLEVTAFPLGQLITFLVPRFFGDETVPLGYWGKLHFVEMTVYPGVATLVLAAGALGGLREDPRRRLTLSLVGLAVLGLLLATRSPLYWLFWRFLPGFGQFTAVARALCLIGWAAAGLAALGVDALLDEGPRRTAAARGALAGAALLGMALVAGLVVEALKPVRPRVPSYFHPEVFPVMAPQLVQTVLWLALGAFVAWAALRDRLPPARLGLLAAGIVTADLFAFGAPFNPAADPALIRVRTPELEALAQVREPYRFVSYGRPDEPRRPAFRDRMSPNLPSVFGIPDWNGSDSFFPRRYLETMRAVSPQAMQASFADPGAPAFRALSARYLLRPGDPPPGFRAVAGALWENPAALPYARVHSNVRYFSDRAEVLAALPTMDPREALVSVPEMTWAEIDRGDGIPDPLPLAARRAGPSRIVLEGSTRNRGLAVVAEAYQPGWRATVDGKPAPVISVNHLIMGVPVPPGTSRIELRYEPSTVRCGLFVSLLTLAALVGAAVSKWRKAE